MVPPSILIVDDNEPSLRATARIIEQAGYRVATAANGREGLRQVRARRPELVLLDVELPDLSGREVLRQIRDDPALLRVAVVFLSAQRVSAEDQVEGLDAGAEGYIARPIAAVELVARVRLHLRQQELTEQLRASEARLLAAQSVAKVGSWEIDLVARQVIGSQEGHRIFGFGPVQGLSSWRDSFLAAVHPDDRARVKAAFLASLRHTSTSTVEHRVKTPDGHIKFVEERWQAEHDEAGRPVRVVGTCRDITEATLAGHRLQRLNRLHTVLSKSGAAVVRIADRRRLYEAVCRIVVQDGLLRIAFVVEKDTVPGRTRLVASCGDESHYLDGLSITTDGGPLSQSTIGTAIRTGRHDVCNDIAGDPRMAPWREAALGNGVLASASFPLRCGNETIGALVLFAGEAGYFQRDEIRLMDEVAGALSFALDVQQQEQARQKVESELRASEANLAAAQGLGHFGSWELDLTNPEDLDANSLRWSAEMYRIAGYEPGAVSVTRKLFYSLVPPEEHGMIREASAAAIRERRQYSIVHRLIRPGGEERIVQETAQVVVDPPTGRVLKLIGTAHDVTGRVRAERELARTNRALRLLSRGNEALIRAHSEAGLLHEICEIAVEVGGARMAWVGYAGDDELKSITPQAHAGFDDGYLSGIKLSWSDDLPSGRGPAARAIRTGLPVIVSDLTDAGAGFESTAEARGRGYGGVVCLPLRDQSVSFGVLVLYFGEVREVPPEELRLLQDLADDMAFGILTQRGRTSRRRTEDAVLTMARGVSASTGADFFEKLTRSLVDALGAHAAVIARIEPPDSPSARTVCAVVAGQTVPDFDFELAGTPCEQLDTNHVGVVPRGASRLFPQARFLVDLAAEALVCQKLFDAAGRANGVLMVAYPQPIEQAEFVSSTLKIFGARAAAELERDRAEAKTREQAALIDEARDGIVVCDLGQVIRFWSKGAERLFGWTEAEAVGRSLDALLHADPIQIAEANRVVREKGEWMGEVQRTARDGRILTISGRWTLLRDARGLPKSILAIDADVTEQRKLEQQFLRAQRLESIGTLAGGIAHDLNNLLAPIVMGAGLLRELEPAESTLEIIRIIERSAKRGTDLVQQVLSFARGVEGARLAVHLKHIVREIEAMAGSTFPKNIEIETNLPNELWLILGDPTQINQVLLNLCVNARDAMPGGGTLTIAAGNVLIDEQQAAKSHGVAAGRYVRLEVIDTGSGMTPAVLERMFEPFFTTKELGRGTGLGLSTVLGIVRSHGGFVNVRSEPGKGSCFQVFFPAHGSDAAAASPSGAETPAHGRGELILVVDDEAPILDITRQTLEAFGYQVITAGDGAEAIALYASRRGEVAVVLTDMMMPVMDGPALIAALRQINPSVRVIAASGLKPNNTSTPFTATGVRHFLPKPYTAAAMLTMLREVLETPPS